MKIFQIKQKMWSLGGKFTISDDFGLPCYQVEGSVFQIPKTFTVRDLEGNFVSQVEKEFSALLPSFKLRLADGTFFNLHKEPSSFSPRYQFDNLNMSVQGDIWDMDFELSQSGQLIARISQEWLRMNSNYQVSIFDEAYRDMVISLVIAIDCAKADQASNH